MTDRRTFLGMVATAPAAGKVAIEQAAQSAVGYGYSVNEAPPHDWPNRGESAADPSWDQGFDIAKKLRRRTSGTDHINVPPRISERKSWSPAFQRHLAQKDFEEEMRLGEEIDNALHGDPLNRIAALTRIANRMGVKI